MIKKMAAIVLVGASFVVLAQNCTSSSFDLNPALTPTEQASSNYPATPATTVPVLKNRIQKLDDGSVNRSYGWRIQNLLIFQAATWSQLTETDKQTVEGVYHDPAWPLCGGKPAYLSKSPQSLRRQMELIRNLNRNTAVAVLMMPRSENEAAGFKACWNGQATDMKTCVGGEWRSPFELYPEVLRAGKARGVPVLPHLSIMGYTSQPSVTEKLRELVEYIVAASKDPALADAVVKTEDGRIVVITEGLAFQPNSKQYPATDLGLLPLLRKEVADYMRARPDVLFIDTLIDDPLHPEMYPPNVVHWAYGQVTDQEFRRVRYGGSFLYHYSPLKEAVRTPEQYFRVDTKLPENERMKLLNLSAETNYPVIISQFNEYGEYLVVEPNTVANANEYIYLRWRLSDQPRLNPNEPVEYGSHPDNKIPFDPASIPCNF